MSCDVETVLILSVCDIMVIVRLRMKLSNACETYLLIFCMWNDVYKIYEPGL